MVGSLRRPMTVVAACLAVAFLAMACSNSSSGTGGSNSQSGSAPGVTSNSITVGALATLSGPLSSGFGDIVYGVKAYFDMINAEGGVDGRKIYLKYVDDDAGSPTTDEDDARNLVVQDHVFAILGVGSPFFSAGQYLAQNDVPTFGYVVIDNWRNYPNLFGAYGSVLDYSTGQAPAAYVAKQLHAKSIAVIAYSIAASSKDACASYADGFRKYGFNVSFEDLNLGYLADPTPDVQQMASKNVDLVLTCVDGPENLKFVQTLHQYGLTNTHVVWLNGYDRNVIAQNASIMTGSIFLVQHVPFEASQYFPGKYPAMDQYIRTMNKYEPKWTYDEISAQGWINAAQFVAGLKSVGQNLTQQRLISAINAEKDFNANGFMPPINPDWKTAHSKAEPPYCSAYLEVMAGGVIKPVFVQNGDQVFICFNGTTASPMNPLPAGVPPNP
jgi:branched-chain amino acid transport system substrate-binding protein